jgi:hypothetical protein
VDVRGHKVIVDVSSLRAGEVDIEDRRSEA